MSWDGGAYVKARSKRAGMPRAGGSLVLASHTAPFWEWLRDNMPSVWDGSPGEGRSLWKMSQEPPDKNGGETRTSASSPSSSFNEVFSCLCFLQKLALFFMESLVH